MKLLLIEDNATMQTTLRRTFERRGMRVLGCTDGHKPRHAKTYRNFAAEFARLQAERIAAFREFRSDVDSAAYPEPRHNVAMSDDEFSTFKAALGQ